MDPKALERLRILNLMTTEKVSSQRQNDEYECLYLYWLYERELQQKAVPLLEM